MWAATAKLVIKHPGKPVGVLLEGEHLSYVFLQSPRALPQLHGRLRAIPLQLPVPKIRRLLRRIIGAHGKQLLQRLQLYAVTFGDLDLDVDAAPDVLDPSPNPPREDSAGLPRRQDLVRQGDTLLLTSISISTLHSAADFHLRRKKPALLFLLDAYTLPPAPPAALPSVR